MDLIVTEENVLKSSKVCMDGNQIYVMWGFPELGHWTWSSGHSAAGDTHTLPLVSADIVTWSDKDEVSSR